MRTTFQLAALAFGVLPAALFSACSDSEQMSYSRTEINDSGSSITINDLVIEVDPDVRYRSLSNNFSYTISGGGVDVNSNTIDGHTFGTADGRFRIGEVEYGPVKADSKIKVSRAGGILIDGEHRGDMPAPVALEEAEAQADPVDTAAE